MKDKLIIIFIIILGAVMYGLTLHGVPGNPTSGQFKDSLTGAKAFSYIEQSKPAVDLATEPFELSPERGRYVHVANMAESGKYDLSPAWGAVAYPDVGISKEGKISSYFAPGVAYMTLPFYKWGASHGYGQLATFGVESIVTIISLVFIYMVGRKMFKMPLWASLFSVLIFAFGSTSWSYAVTLYQNAFTAMFMITAFYATWRYAQNNSRFNWLYASYVWLAYALAITVDYPNAVLMLPVMVYLAVSTFKIHKVEEGLQIGVRWVAIFTFVFFAFITGLQMSHNATYYGGPTKLAGELQHYTFGIVATTTTTNSAGIVTAENKSAVGFFHEDKMPNGLYVLLFSDERGLFFFTPIFLFSLFGIWYAVRKKNGEEVDGSYIVPIALIITNVFLYSSWGDPWGGWAFGPRYLIPTLPYMALFVGLSLTQGDSIWKRIIVFPFFLYSSAVSLVGVLTTNAVPPKSEALLLPDKTYNFLKNIPLIMDNKSASFAFNEYFSNTLTLVGYFVYIYITLVILAFLVLFIVPIFEKEKIYE